MKYKKIYIFCLMICIIFSLSSVYANGLNDADLQQDKPIIKMANENEIILSSDNGTFSDLNDEIQNANDELILYKNYTYTDDDSNLRRGIPITKSIIIDGNGFTINGDGKSRAFNIIQGKVILKNIHLTNCFAYENDLLGDTRHGGAIVFKNVNDCKIINSTFTKNYASRNGGTIIFRNAKDCEIINSTFEHSHGKDGGAIYLYSSTLNIENSNFNDNYASYEGGAVHMYDSVLTMKSSNFTNNEARYGGGALYFSSSSGRLENCKFKKNIVTNKVSIPLERQYVQDDCLINCSFDNSDINKAIGGGLRNITKLEVTINNNIVDITVINPNFYYREDFDGQGYFLAIEKYPFPNSHKSWSEKDSLKLYDNHATTSIDPIHIGLNEYRVYYYNFINTFYYYFNIVKTVQSEMSIDSPIIAERGNKASFKIRIDNKLNSYGGIVGNVEFTIDGKNYHVPVKNGESEIPIRLPKKPGTFSYNVIFKPDSEYVNGTSAILKIVSKYGTKITTKSVTGYQGKKVKLTATVKDDTGNKIKSGKVTFNINGKIYNANVKNGLASITIKYPKAKWYNDNIKTKGKYRYETSYYKSIYSSSVSFKGDDGYMSSSAKFKVTSKGKPVKHKYRIYNYRTFILPVKNTLKFYNKGSVVLGVGMKHLSTKNILIIGVGDKNDHPVPFKVQKHYKKNGNWRWDSWFYCDEKHYMETTYGHSIKIDKVKINCYSPYFVKIY